MMVTEVKADPSRMRILVGADVPPNANAGAAGTVLQMNRALERMGHVVDEIWDRDLPHRVKHGNLHYLLELPRRYRDAVRARSAKADYDVVELNQPHAYLAARDHRLSGRRAAFVCRTQGWEARSREELARWQGRFGSNGRGLLRVAISGLMQCALARHETLVCRYADGVVASCSEDAEYVDHLSSV